MKEANRRNPSNLRDNDVCVGIEIPREFVALVLGKELCNILRIEERTGARIIVPTRSTSPFIVAVSGPIDPVCNAALDLHRHARLAAGIGPGRGTATEAARQAEAVLRGNPVPPPQAATATALCSAEAMAAVRQRLHRAGPARSGPPPAHSAPAPNLGPAAATSESPRAGSPERGRGRAVGEHGRGGDEARAGGGTGGGHSRRAGTDAEGGLAAHMGHVTQGMHVAPEPCETPPSPSLRMMVTFTGVRDGASPSPQLLDPGPAPSLIPSPSVSASASADSVPRPAPQQQSRPGPISAVAGSASHGCAESGGPDVARTPRCKAPLHTTDAEASHASDGQGAEGLGVAGGGGKMAVAAFSQGRGEAVAGRWAGWAGRGEGMRLEVEAGHSGGFVVRVWGVEDAQVGGLMVFLASCGPLQSLNIVAPERGNLPDPAPPYPCGAAGTGPARIVPGPRNGPGASRKENDDFAGRRGDGGQPGGDSARVRTIVRPCGVERDGVANATRPSGPPTPVLGEEKQLLRHTPSRTEGNPHGQPASASGRACRNAAGRETPGRPTGAVHGVELHSRPDGWGTARGPARRGGSVVCSLSETMRGTGAGRGADMPAVDAGRGWAGGEDWGPTWGGEEGRRGSGMEWRGPEGPSGPSNRVPGDGLAGAEVGGKRRVWERLGTLSDGRPGPAPAIRPGIAPASRPDPALACRPGPSPAGRPGGGQAAGAAAPAGRTCAAPACRQGTAPAGRPVPRPDGWQAAGATPAGRPAGGSGLLDPGRVNDAESRPIQAGRPAWGEWTRNVEQEDGQFRSPREISSRGHINPRARGEEATGWPDDGPCRLDGFGWQRHEREGWTSCGGGGGPGRTGPGGQARRNGGAAAAIRADDGAAEDRDAEWRALRPENRDWVRSDDGAVWATAGGADRDTQRRGTLTEERRSGAEERDEQAAGGWGRRRGWTGQNAAEGAVWDGRMREGPGPRRWSGEGWAGREDGGSGAGWIDEGWEVGDGEAPPPPLRHSYNPPFPPRDERHTECPVDQQYRGLPPRCDTHAATDSRSSRQEMRYPVWPADRLGGPVPEGQLELSTGGQLRGEAGLGVKDFREKAEEGEVVSVEANNGWRSGSEIARGNLVGLGGLEKEAGGEVELLLRELQVESEDQEVCFGVHIPPKVVGLVIGLQHRHARQIRDTCRVQLWTPLASDPVKTVVVRGQLRSCAAALHRILGLARRPLRPANPSCEQRDTAAAAEADTAVRLVTDPEVLRRITGPSEQDTIGCPARPARDASSVCRVAVQGRERFEDEVEGRHKTISGGGGGARDDAARANDYRIRCNQQTAGRSLGGGGQESDSGASDEDPAPSLRSLRRRRRAGHCVSQSPSPSVASSCGSSRGGSRNSRWKSSQRGRTSTPSTPNCSKSGSPDAQRRTPSPCASLHSGGRDQTESLSQSWSPATPGGRTSPGPCCSSRSPLNSDNDQPQSSCHTSRRRRKQSQEFPSAERASERASCDSQDESRTYGQGKDASPSSPGPLADKNGCGADKSKHSVDDVWRESGCSFQESPVPRIRQCSANSTLQSKDVCSSNHLPSSPSHGTVPSLDDRSASFSPCSRPVSPSEEFESAKRAAAAAAAVAAVGRKVVPSACRSSGGAEKQVVSANVKRKRQVAAVGASSGTEPAFVGGPEQRGKAGASEACTPLLSSAAAERTPSAVARDSEKRRRLQYGRPQLQQSHITGPLMLQSNGLEDAGGSCPNVVDLGQAGGTKLPLHTSNACREGNELLASKQTDQEKQELAAGSNQASQKAGPASKADSIETWQQAQLYSSPASNVTGNQFVSDVMKSSQREKKETSNQQNEDNLVLKESMPDVEYAVNCESGPMLNQSGSEKACSGFPVFTEQTSDITASIIAKFAKIVDKQQRGQFPEAVSSGSSAIALKSTEEEADHTSFVNEIKILQVQPLKPQDVSSPEIPVGVSMATITSVPAVGSRIYDVESEIPSDSHSVLLPGPRSKEVSRELHHKSCTLHPVHAVGVSEAAAVAVETTAAAASIAVATDTASVAASIPASVFSESTAVLLKDCIGESKVEQTGQMPMKCDDAAYNATCCSVLHSVSVQSSSASKSVQSSSASKSEECSIVLDQAKELQHTHGAKSDNDQRCVERAEVAAAADSAICGSSTAQHPVQKKQGKGSAAGRRAAACKAAAAAAKAVEAEADAARTSPVTSASPAGSTSTVPTISRNPRAGVAKVGMDIGKDSSKESVQLEKSSSISVVVGSEGKKAKFLGSAGKWMQCWSTEGRLYWHDKSSGMSTWDKPKELMSEREKRSQWKAYVGPENSPYYFNSTTGESTWDRPADLESDSDQPLESDTEFPTNVTAAAGARCFNDGTTALQGSGHSSQAANINSERSLSNLNGEELNAEIGGRDKETEQDSVSGQYCLPTKVSTIAEKEKCSRLSIDIEKEKPADHSCGGIGPRGRGRPRGRGGKGRGAGGRKKDSGDFSLAGETQGGVLAERSNSRTQSTSGKGHDSELRKESLHEAVTGCFKAAEAMEGAHIDPSAVVLDESAPSVKACSTSPAQALRDSEAGANTAKISIVVAESVGPGHVEPSSTAGEDAANATSGKTSTVSATDAEAAEEKQKVVEGIVAAAGKEGVEAKKAEEKKPEVAATAAEVTVEVRSELLAVAAKDAVDQDATGGEAAVAKGTSVWKEGCTSSCELSEGMNVDAASRENCIFGSTVAETQSTGDLMHWEVCQRTGNLSPRISNDLDLHLQIHRASNGISRVNEESGELSAALDVSTPRTPAHSVPEPCTPISPMSHGYVSAELHRRLSDSQQADDCMGFRISGSYGNKVGDTAGPEEVEGNRSPAPLALPFRQSALSPEPTITTRQHTSESPAQFGFGAVALDASTVQAGSRPDTPSQRGSGELQQESPTGGRPLALKSPALDDPAARKECSMSPWLASFPNNNRPSTSPTNRPSCGGSTWCARGMQSIVGNLSCNGEPPVGGDSDEELGENLFDARNGSYDELYIGATGTNVFTSQFGLGTNSLHGEGISDCAAPDLSCNSSFCGDSDVLAECTEGQGCARRPKLALNEGGAEVQSPGCDSDTTSDRCLGGGALGDGWWVGTGGNDRQTQKRRKISSTAATAADVIAAGVGFSGRGSSVVMAAVQNRTCSLCGRSGHNRRTCLHARPSSSLTDGLRSDVPNVLNQAQGAQWVLRGDKGGVGTTPLCSGTLVEALYDNGLWYEGVIESHDSATGRYKITFPDGESVTTPLPDDNFRILSCTGPTGQVPSDASMAPTFENGKFCCVPAPVCNGGVQVYLMAATSGGAGGFVAKPLDYAQACLLPRPTPWTVPPQLQLEGKASTVPNMEMSGNGAAAAACHLKASSEPETGQASHKLPASGSKLGAAKNEGICCQGDEYHTSQGQAVGAKPDADHLQEHTCQEGSMSTVAFALKNSTGKLSSAVMAARTSDQPPLPPSPSNDNQIEANAEETNHSAGGESFPTEEAGNVTLCASTSEDAAVIPFEGGMSNSTGSHTSSDWNSSSEQVIFGGKGSLVDGLIDGRTGKVKMITSSQPDKCLPGNVETNSVIPGGCQLAMSLSQTADDQPSDDTQMKYEAFAAPGRDSSLGRKIHSDSSASHTKTVMNQASEPQEAQPVMIPVMETLADFNSVPDADTACKRGEQYVNTSCYTASNHQPPPPPPPGFDRGVVEAVAPQQSEYSFENFHRRLGDRDISVTESVTANLDKLACNVAAPIVSKHAHLSMVNEDAIQAQGSKAAMIATDPIVIEATSKQENKMYAHGAANQLHGCPCAAVALEGKHSESTALNPEALTSTDSNHQIINSNVGVEIAGLPASEQSLETTETSSEGASHSLAAVALNSDSSGEQVCSGSNASVHIGVDMHINTNTKVCTADNNAVCMAGQGTVDIKANKRLVQCDKARQLNKSLRETKRQKSAVLLHAVTDINAASSQAGGEEAPWLWWWKELDLLPQRRNGLPAIGAHVVVQGQHHQAPRRGVVIDIMGKCWCNVALEDDEFGTQQLRGVYEPNHTVRCRTNLVRVISAAEEDRIRATAAKRAASFSAASDQGLGKTHAAQSLPLDKASPIINAENDNAESCCVEDLSSKQMFLQPTEKSCYIQGSEVIYPIKQQASLSCPEISSESSQSSNLATEQQLSFTDNVPQSNELSKTNQQAGEDRTEQCMNDSSPAAVQEDQCVEQMSSQQQGCCGTSTRRSLLIIPVSDFTPVTAEPAISWAFFGSDSSGTLPKRMRAPSS